MRLILSLIASLLLATPLIATPVRAEEPLYGRWLTHDAAAIIRIGRCGSNVCGVIDRVLAPNAPINDVNNPDPSRRQRPLVGTAVLTGFRRSIDGWDGGQVYDPKAGRRYRSQMQLRADGKLSITGCLFVICRTKIWTRAD